MAGLTWTFSPDKRQRLRDADTKWKSKAWLRSACTLLAFLAMCLFAAAVAQTIAWQKKWTFEPSGNWQDGMCLAPVMLSLLLSPLLLFLSLSRPIKAKKPLHPAVPLTIDLIIWMLCVPSLVWSVGTGWYFRWQPVYIEINGRIPCNRLNAFTESCQPDIYRIGGIEIAANILLCFLLIFHFTLFVLSCIAVHRLRRRNRLSQSHPNLHNAQSTTDPTSAQRNIELQYHRSPEEHALKSPGIPPAYHSGVPGSVSSAGLHRGDGKTGSGRSFGSSKSDPDHGHMRLDSDGNLDGRAHDKDLEAGRNPFGDDHDVDGSKVHQPPRDRIEGAIKYM